eukprot:365130-Chlamydomonas_euryale.AAC.22
MMCTQAPAPFTPYFPTPPPAPVLPVPQVQKPPKRPPWPPCRARQRPQARRPLRQRYHAACAPAAQ